jgi:hypothetical protein
MSAKSLSMPWPRIRLEKSDDAERPLPVRKMDDIRKRCRATLATALQDASAQLSQSDHSHSSYVDQVSCLPVKTASSRQFPSIHESKNPLIQPSELSPTFRLDGGTVPHQKISCRIQKPLIFRTFPRCKSPEKRTVPFDIENFTFFRVLSENFRIFSRLFKFLDNMPT